MPHPDDGGPADPPSRSDLNLWAQALRNDWPIPAKVKQRLLQVAINIADPDDADDPKAKPPTLRTRLSAMKVISAFAKLSLEQQRLDLARERLALGKDEEATDPAGGLDPARAANALRALNEQPAPAPVDPRDPPGHP